MKKIERLLFLFSVLFLLNVLILGCATTQPTSPNISALYRIPDLKAQLPLLQAKSQPSPQESLPATVQTLFQQLYALDSTLALEVGRLPEFQDKVGEKQVIALSRFLNLVKKAPPEEKTNLAKLLQVGKPAFRRYSAPLQAIFWLLERDGYQEQNLLRYPSDWILDRILTQAWDFTEQNRWRDFEVVTERLNSPELINFYEQMNFRYEYHGECPGYAQFIFKSKRGCCSDYTAFSEYTLEKAGYKARAIKVVSPTGKKYHVVCEYEDKGKKYIMDNSAGYRIKEKEIYVKRLPQIGYGYQ